MKLTVLKSAPSEVYYLIHKGDVVDTLVACLPDGSLFRTAFLISKHAEDTLYKWAEKFPKTTFIPAPRGFKADYSKGVLSGTDFQIKVWKQLAGFKPKQTMTYAMMAEKIGHPNASRAVGTAVGNNPLAPFIPCHRILASNGGIGGFMLGAEGGIELKKKLLKKENIAI